MGYRTGKVIFYDVLLKKNRCRSSDVRCCTEVVQTAFFAGFFRAKSVPPIAPPNPPWNAVERGNSSDSRHRAQCPARARQQLALVIGAPLGSSANTYPMATTGRQIHGPRAGAVFSTE